MNRKLWKWVMCLLVAIMFVNIPQAVNAEGYVEGKTGTVTVTLQMPNSDGTENVPISGISFRLYKVGNLTSTGPISFDVVDELQSTGVEYSELTVASKVAEAASKLAEAVKSADSLQSVEGTSDSNGQMVFQDVEPGMYLLVQSGQEDTYEAEPALLTVPYAKDETGWEYNVPVYPKLEKKDQNNEIKVIKSVYQTKNGDVFPLVCDDYTYYARVFLDKEGTIPYGDIITLHIVDDYKTKEPIVIKNLPEGTYYVYETDKDGKAYPLNKAFVDFTKKEDTCTITVNDEDTNSVTMAKGDATEKTVEIRNRYDEFTPEFSQNRNLNITKEVLDKDGGKMSTSDTFYATVYEVNGDEETLITTVQLNNNGTVNVKLPVDESRLNEDITYRVYETDADGNAINKEAFNYKVTEAGDVVFDSETESKDVKIVNQEKPETDKPTTEATTGVHPQTTTTQKKNDTTHSSSNSSSHSTKTGDNTPIEKWLFLGGAALIVIIAMVVIKKKRKE